MNAKLAYITTIADTQWGFLAGQNAFMARHGFELHAIASPGSKMDELVRRDGVQAHPVSISRQIRPLSDLISLVRLFLALRRIRPDIVHVSTSKAAVLGATAAWLAGAPLRVFLIRGLASENAGGIKRRLFRLLEWYTARICHATICVAPSLLDFARGTGIIGSDQGRVMANGMSNGVDVERFDPGRTPPAALQVAGEPLGRRPVIGFVGRLDRDKGVLEIAEMWRQVRAEEPRSVLLLVGPWESRDRDVLEARRVLEADPRVITTGWVDDVAPYFRAMDLLLMPSHGTEGFPNAPMQGACMGLPVIASRVVGCVDAVLDGETGRLIPPRDAGALTVAVRAYLAEPPLRRRHGENGRRRVLQDFRREPIWRALLEEYRRLLQWKNMPCPPAAGPPAPSPSGKKAAAAAEAKTTC